MFGWLAIYLQLTILGLLGFSPLFALYLGCSHVGNSIWRSRELRQVVAGSATLNGVAQFQGRSSRKRA